jgi:exopolysaccharide production protein ExoY
MGSASELLVGSIAEKHSEATVNRHVTPLRDPIERPSRDIQNSTRFRTAASAASTFPVPVDRKSRAALVATPVGGWMKRGFDITVALTSILLMAPIMLIIAGLILITMGRPVFFVQKRAGFNRTIFGCFKFRTMVTDADERLARYLQHCPEAARAWAETQKLNDDPRVTWLGHILRKSSLDELPQLFNVLRGEMSCIGPRPVTVNELNTRYGITANDYARAKPGVTGMWQVNGRSATTYSRRVAYDRFYVRHWSFLLDVAILLRTIPALLKTDQTS